jgi:acetyl esterase/lipase
MRVIESYRSKITAGRFECTAVAVVMLCFSLAGLAEGQRRAHLGYESPQRRGGTDACFDSNDQNDILLWQGSAPGAAGNDPCRDVPFLRVFRASEPVSTTAFLITPGGGYDRLTDAKEQTPVAEYFAQVLHVTSFVLYYRLVQPNGTYRYPVPMWDGQRAIRIIRARAQLFGIDPHKIGIFGFSAGGHLASTLALHSGTDFDLLRMDDIDRVSARPDLLGLGYAVISMDPSSVPPTGSYKNLLKGYEGTELSHLQRYLSGEKNVTPRTPPVFLFESMDDATISPQNSVLFVDALREAGIPIEAHLFRHGQHGAGLATGVAEEEAWPEMFRKWLATH